MAEGDLLPARVLLRNGALLIIPPMIISFGLWGALPAAYSPDLFWKDIPTWLVLPENIFRLLVFSLPGILYFGKKEMGQSLGWYLYFGGLLFYLASYLAQIVFPASVWSRSAIGFTAPAWSTLFWLAGIGLVCARSWLPIPWHRAIYLWSAFLFLIFHLGHTGLVYCNLTR
ncbi:MAG: hypothetical protein HOP19_16795 [Acidobacteria bacterium]|nr:hypothetical protein [Acidobacteriota bacterium]